MNGPHTPAWRRDNKWTRLIERAGAQNAADGKPAGRMIEQMAMAQPLIPASRVRRMSREEAARTDYIPEPEDPRAAMMASARAAALGITNDPVDNDDLPGDIGHVAGEVTDAEIDAMLAAAKGQSVPGAQSAGEGAATREALAASQAAGQRVALPRGQTAPQLGLGAPRTMPDFSKVEGFDLTRKVAVVDGMEFRIPEEDVVAMKKFAIQVVLDNVTFQLAQALVALGIPQEMAEKTAATMKETAAAGSTPGGMKRGDGAAAGESTRTLEEVRPDQEGKGETSKVRTIRESPDSTTEIPDDGQGGSTTTQEQSGARRETDDTSYLLGDGGVTPS